jgi:hypothetical protein
MAAKAELFISACAANEKDSFATNFNAMRMLAALADVVDCTFCAERV